MDYLEEQKNEIEALESIYYGDIKILETEPKYRFTIPIKSEDYEEDTNNGMACDLTFTYTEKYPDEGPIIEIEDPVNFLQNNEKELEEFLQGQVQENLGMVMIFTLVSSGQEWLSLKWENVKKEREEIVARKLMEEEEAERKRFEGTKVTVETFMKWKMAFEDEVGITKKREIIEREGKKLTGRELFIRDNTLNESDLKFLADGESVKVDESLFQDLEDLDLDDDDDEDDEDFDPDNCDSDDS
ncbi:RWD domain-containing protein 1 [Coccinella septempunctata]|uniref:RWD domain-containing protein 1 n=1 Tax=Coccinella septempunctata TaxID=41139 RepID=UPI001D096BEA|nr:RWD domain-containing protein 1 [Coccinella septempunctata]